MGDAAEPVIRLMDGVKPQVKRLMNDALGAVRRWPGPFWFSGAVPDSGHRLTRLMDEKFEEIPRP